MGRRVGGMGRAELCRGCGALCPNSWCDPYGYVHHQAGAAAWVYCSVDCERTATTPQGNEDPGYLEGGRYGS